MEPHFFQAFFNPQQGQIQQQKPEYIIHNEYILEIVNNWEYVKVLMKTFRDGKLQQMDQMEQTWLTFLTQKGIDITKYTNEQEFLQAFWRNP
jgi:hypothetical protein